MRKIFHLELKSDNSHRYYGSLVALFSDKEININVSKGKLDRFDFNGQYFENDICKIRKSILVTKTYLENFN